VTITTDIDKGLPPAGQDLALLAQLRESAVVRQLVPPLTLEQLYAQVDAFIRETASDPVFRDWLVVMLNNCLWEETIATIPCDKRVLLLPECLKHSGKCQAEHDDFGLLCGCCGNCTIGSLLDEAEARGMMTLVAEGSTMVADLIKSGDVQAVIGVSCLEALEKAFPEMIGAAVPGLAIPLSKSGCVDTKMSQELLRQAISIPHQAGVAALGPVQLKKSVEQWFEPAVLAEIVGPGASVVEALGHEWLSGDGKRWRPYLTAALFAAATDRQEFPLDVKKLAVAAECFHKASLIHDDIEDNDLERYGKETLHARIGTGQALNVGDFLIGEGYRMIAETTLPAEARIALLQAAVTAHRQLTLGQGMELAWMRQPERLTVEQTLECFRLKTAPAFEAALAFGAIAAGIHGETQSLIHDFSKALGIGYQIADDLVDFSPETLCEAPSIVLAYLSEAHPQLNVVELRDQALAGKLDADIFQAKAASKELLATCRARAFASLASLKKRELKLFFFRIAGRILK
jgi:geranylgeranyl pyrophosphate synthase